MGKRKTVLVLLFLIYVKTGVLAQVADTLGMLTGKEWVAQFDVENVPKYGCVYTAAKETTFMVVQGERHEISADYYLSDAPVTSFDASKIGKNKSGRYIVVNLRVRDGEDKPWYYKVSNFEILKISDNLLVTRNTGNAFIITYECEPGSTYFIWKPAVGGGTSIVPKGKENVVLKKPEAYLDWFGYEGHIPWHEDVEVKPFQALIDKGYFSSDRMRDLEKNAKIWIVPYFDEGGIISYVEFWLPDNVTTALTDEELYVINQAYTGVKMDLSFVTGRNSVGRKLDEYYCSGVFEIPFEDLEY